MLTVRPVEVVVVVEAVEVVVAEEEIVLKVIGPELPTEVAVVVNAKKETAYRLKEVVDVETATVVVKVVVKAVVKAVAVARVKSKGKVETVVAVTTDPDMTALPKTLREERLPNVKVVVKTKNMATKESPGKNGTLWTSSQELAVVNAIKESQTTVLDRQERTRKTILPTLTVLSKRKRKEQKARKSKRKREPKRLLLLKRNTSATTSIKKKSPKKMKMLLKAFTSPSSRQ